MKKRPLAERVALEYYREHYPELNESDLWAQFNRRKHFGGAASSCLIAARRAIRMVRREGRTRK